MEARYIQTEAMMDDFQGRVIAEKRELDARRSMLGRFMCGDVYPTLDDTDQDLLIDQLDAMKQ